jgi:hypothetical protein
MLVHAVSLFNLREIYDYDPLSGHRLQWTSVECPEMTDFTILCETL